MNQTVNPLKNFTRVPKLSVTLPSRGKWGSPANIGRLSQELDIYSMSSADELLMANPHGLVNGENIIKLLKSCTGIDNPYDLVNNDMEYLLVAIKRATVGPEYDVTVSCPNIEKDEDGNDMPAHENTVSINLDKIIESQEELIMDEIVTLDSGLSVKLKPRSFGSVQKIANIQYKDAMNYFAVSQEEVRLQTKIAELEEKEKEIPSNVKKALKELDAEKLKLYNSTFNNQVSTITETMIDSIDSVTMPTQSINPAPSMALQEEEDFDNPTGDAPAVNVSNVTNNVITDRAMIAEWANDLPKNDAEKILEQIGRIADMGFDHHVENVKCQKCEHVFKARIDFNAANFFVPEL